MSDKAHIHLNISANKLNCHYWATENPQELHERPRDTSEVMFQCTNAKLGIIEPHYINMRNNFVRA